MRLKKRYVLAVVAVGVFAAFSAVAIADSAHFIGTPTCTKSLSTGLTCSGKAAGLGNGPTEAFLTADSVSATYECVNKGGNVAPGQPVVESSTGRSVSRRRSRRRPHRARRASVPTATGVCISPRSPTPTWCCTSSSRWAPTC
jgi:hypothetical protein